VVAWGLLLRVALDLAELSRRVRTWIAAPRYALALGAEGMLLRTPEVDVALPREAAVGVIERGRWMDRRGSRRFSEVFVVVDPSDGRTHLTLPPVFDGSPGRLTERLMRWRGAWDDTDGPPRRPPHELASRVYDAAAAGRAEPGITAIRHGREWLLEGPYAVLLVALAVGDGIARGGEAVWSAIEPLVGGGLVLGFAALPARWLWMQRREVAPRLGLSMVLTPAELLIRTQRGMLRTQWQDLVSVTVVSRRRWSVLQGPHDARQLVLSRRAAPPIRYDENYLGTPVEVAQVLLEAHRTGRLPRIQAGAAQC
jgi:hypothetical protein